MFTKGKGPEGPGISPSPSMDAIRPAMGKPSARVVPSIISADMRITGSILSQGEMTIDGKIEGDVKADSLTIGSEGEIIGEIIAQQVIVRGKVKGSIRARKVELEAGAHVQGDIVHARLSIQNDAVFEGQVKHAEDPLKNQSVAATPAPVVSPAPPMAAPAAPSAPVSAPVAAPVASTPAAPASTPFGAIKTDMV